MRFVTIREMRQKSKELWEQLKEHDEIILTSNGKPIALMTGVDESNIETFLRALRRAKASLAIEEMQQHALKSGTDKLTTDEIQQEITAVRRSRNR